MFEFVYMCKAFSIFISYFIAVITLLNFEEKKLLVIFLFFLWYSDRGTL